MSENSSLTPVDPRIVEMETVRAHRIDHAIERAIKAAGNLDRLNDGAKHIVRFVFNGVVMLIRADSTTELLLRDFHRALEGCIHETVGPYPTPALSDEEQAQDQEVKDANELSYKEAEAARQAPYIQRDHIHQVHLPGQKFLYSPWQLGDGAWIDLITPEHYVCLPAGTVLRCIDGQTVTKGVDYIDGDTRGGFLAYGFHSLAKSDSNYEAEYRGGQQALT